jgi:ribosomal protein S18 acetylase RimI-like enzyme
MTDGFTIKHYGQHEADDVLDIITGLYTASHADVIEADSFLSVDRFHTRLTGYRRSPGFELVIAYAGEPLGLAFGYPLPREAAWWDGLITSVDPELIAETGTRTFALNEIMVHPGYQGEGVAHALHAELMAHRPEQRATLLVRRDNEAAQAAYARWGYTSIGRLQPFPDAPVYDALVLDLSSSR